MATLPLIVGARSAINASLLNLETDEQIDFDLVNQQFSQSLGASYTIESIYKSQGLSLIYTGDRPETKSFTCYVDRYWQGQDTRPIINSLRAWQKPTKNRVPPLVAFQWGDNLFSPSIFNEGITIVESGFVKGIPTKLEVSFILLKVPDKAIVY
jgi:hypothetical protein